MLRWLGGVLLWIALAVPAPAALLAELDTSTPQATVASFRSEARRIEALFLAYQAAPSAANQVALTQALTRGGRELLDLSDAPPATRIKHGAMAFGLLADILIRLPELPTAEAPVDPHVMRWTLPGTEIRLVRVAQGPAAGNWIFSAETLAHLPEFHAAIIDTPPLRPVTIVDWGHVQRSFTGPMLAGLPLARLPGPLQWDLLGSPAWKVLLTLLVLVAVGVVGIAWLRFVRRRSAGLVPWQRQAAMLSVAGLFALLLDLAYSFITWQIVLAGGLSDAGLIFTTFAIYLAGAWGAWIGCWLVAEAIIAAPSFPERVYDANLMRLLARVCSLILAAVMIVLGANEAGVPALGLLAGVSIGGLALALAAQATVENLLGGISIFADRPFRVGDSIAFGAARGVVVSIGPRSSRIRAADGTVTSVPNADLAKSLVTNLSERDRWIFQHKLTLPHAAPAARVAALVEEMRRRMVAEPLVGQSEGWPRVNVTDVGEDGLEIQISAQVMTQDEVVFLGVQQGLILAALDAIAAAGFELSSKG